MKKPVQILPIFTFVFTLLLLSFTLSCKQEEEKGLAEEEVKALTDQYLEIWNEGKIEVVDEIFSPEYVLHDYSLGKEYTSLDEYKSFVKRNRTAFPDLNVSIDETVVEGNKLVIRWTMTGTHEGPLGEVPPTGKKVNMYGVNILNVINGKFTEEWTAYSALDMYKKLGYKLAAPSPPEEEKK